ncbi:protein ESSENTIAL FOR POTEXVIRUS ACCUMULATION 1 isoform X2 [Benincasa hispida]|uniref:protein ESSENTIAL FOR POTEXVIRUS ACCUMULATION 1 isoform X2 n=1 Tax=Benincasa hispida TaxID=102211 RepID=UPI001900AFB6|nr:protein ESSENTIAL FOR POTEXVIRUS ACCUMULATION 1 isoform X2 [Benincasa hispida]
MAGRFDFGSRPNLSVSSPLHAANDVQGSENPIPLSPQWLLPKPGESKHGIGTGENHFSHQPAYGNRMDTMKGSENYEDINDIQKKKEVFRPSLTDSEIGRRDRWHDEERENNSSMRKDRWRDGEKEMGDSRKMDRWNEDSSTRVFRESRRGPSERWSDSNNRDNVHYDQRRESKWNTRWGPDDKETEGFREKRLDSGRDGDLHLDKNLSHVSNYGKNDRDGDHYRPWRSNSSQVRGKGDPPHHQSQTPIKQVPAFSHRGRGDNTPPTFSLGRGIISSGVNPTNSIYSSSNYLGASSEKSGREPYHYKYSRTKLLDVFRTTNLTSQQTPKDGFVPVPTLTLDEPLEPLALCAPTTEEMTFLKGIDKGEIVSSGAPQVSKDGRNSSEFMQTRRTKLSVSPSLGSREDLPHGFVDDYNDDKDDGTTKPGHTNYSEVSTERQVPYHRPQSKIEAIQEHMTHTSSTFKSEAFREDNNAMRKTDEVPVNRESSVKGGTNVHPGSTWDASSLEQPLNTSLPDRRENPNNISSGTPDKGWLQSSKNLNDGWGSNTATPSYPKDNPKWQTGEESIIRRQLSGILDKEQLARKTVQSAPEDLQLHYIDPSGAIQGPFSGADIIQWFEGGYFGLDLPVRPVNAPNDLPFAALGDVMPHLRSKAKPPPGFSGPKQNEFADSLGNASYGSLGKLHTGLNEIDTMRNETRHKHGSTVEAENRFLESLMSGNIGSSPLEKNAFSEGYFGNNSSSLSSLGIDNGNNLFLLAKRMELERQRSLSNPYAFWPGIDATSKVSKPDIGLDDPIQQAKLLSSIIDHSRQTSHSQGADMSAILQGLSDKAPPGINDVAGWSKFAQCAPDPLQSKLDLHHDLNLSSQAPFGFQQQRLQPQPSLTNLLAQATDNPTLTPDKFLPSSLSQDPQLISKLQQQHLLQLHSQVPFSAQQMSLLDKLLLLKQQQKQEEQQQLLQQQQLLSQVLSEHQSRQHFIDPSFGQLQGAPMPIGNASTDPAQVQQSREKFQIGSQKPLNVVTDRAAPFGNMALQVTQGASYNVNLEDPPLALPHQMFGNVVQQKSWTPALSEQLNDTCPNDMLPGSKVAEGSLFPGLTAQSNEDVNLVPKSSDSHTSKALEQIAEDVPRLDATVTSLASDALVEPLPLKTAEISVAIQPAEVHDFEISIPDSVPALKVQEASMPVEKLERDVCKDETSLETELKNVEVQEPRKSSDKKTKKQKSSKLLSSDQAKDSKSSAIQQLKQSKSGKSENDLKLKADNIVGKSSDTSSSPRKIRDGDGKTSVVDSQPVQSSASAINTWNDGETIQMKDDARLVGSDSVLNSQTQSGQRAWKVASSFKPKSLLEIQEEEQKRAHTETAVSDISTSINSMSLSTPWAGIVSSSDPKTSREIHKDSGISESSEKHENLLTSRSRKSQLHDLLAEDDMEKSTAGDVRVSDSVQIASSPRVMATQAEPLDDNFIEAKDTKKSRKKSAKAKGVGTKATPAVPSADVVASSPIEKGKISRQTQQEKEAMPAIPSGPSFGDFVLWKGETANVAPPPAWSSDSGKVPKPTSLRDIQKEQGRKISAAQHSHQNPTPQKAQPTQAGRSSSTSTPSWALSASSPSKAASSPLQNIPTQSKHGGDDDLFWGPIEAKQENQQVDVRLGSHGSWGNRSASAKAVASTGLLSRQKSSGGKADYLSSSPAQSSQKGKQDPVTKHSEAMGFRDWCESECVRLIGTKDTSFLEFCLKQSRSEAELFLIENLGSYDPDHDFIDQFLNYKELLPADVLEIAFQSRNDRKVSAIASREVNSGNAGGDVDPDVPLGRDGSAKSGGKKKGKKGKKVSPSVLGFNVVSNRIMMGEIQTVED